MDLSLRISRKKSIFTQLLITLLISLIAFDIYSQQAFTLKNIDNSGIKIDKFFTANTEIKPFTPDKPISGLVISCDIVLNSDTSLVRIIMVDDNQKEFLVCEVYSLLIESNNISLKDHGEETVLLNNIIPHILKVEIINASIHLKEITTSQQEQYIAKIALDKSQQQHADKIKKINENIKKKGGLWAAGETSVSSMTYEEKKQLFGGSIPNLQGFEYYIGGIFVMPGTDIQTLSKSTVSIYAKEFSWRNRHNQDWVTSVKNQGGCGSCWAFAAVGATELLVNLYYNQHLNIDLSEQHVVSCFNAGNCSGGWTGKALDNLIETGVIEESCFPYKATDEICDNKCTNPSETIRINSYEYSQWLNDTLAKSMLIEGPVACGLSFWAHVLTLVGYKVIEEGDTFFDRFSLITIYQGHPLIGMTAWIMKNSWGNDWGDNGYVYIISNPEDLRFYELFSPVISSNYNDSDIMCLDNDTDGYYTWGIGSKPVHCTNCPDKPDGDDSDPCSGPMDAYGNIQFLTSLPIARDTSILVGNTIPDLYAKGENISWYSDVNRSFLIHSGNNFKTNLSNPGNYTFYVTQTLLNCESNALPVTLEIKTNKPVAKDITVYYGEPIPELTASGDSITWYGDPDNPLVDSRDGQYYATAKIGNQLWMAENLNYCTPQGSWYYNNDSISYADVYGRLYDWKTALNSCPVSWHVPSDEEWIELEMLLGMSWSEAHNFGWRGHGIGSKLKEVGNLHWIGPNINATNEFNFSALPAGTCYYGAESFGFSHIGMYTGFLTSSQYNSDDTYIVHILDKYSDDIGRYYDSNPTAFSVRCIFKSTDPLFHGNTYKPVYSLPGTYVYYATQTIYGYESLADTVIFTILPEAASPEAKSITVCEKNQIPDLFAEGKNIQWYSDAQLENLVHSGNTFSTGITDTGSYRFYVIQTIDDFASKQVTVVLTIVSIPPPPIAFDVQACENKLVPALKAIGQNIQWYSDAGLNNSVYSGNDFITGQSSPGFANYYVTQSVSGCEGFPDTVVMTILPAPSPPFTFELYICEDLPVPELTAAGEDVRWYSDSILTNLIYSGNSYPSGQTDPGNYTYYTTQTVSGCESDFGIINLNINPIHTNNITEVACTSYESPSNKYTWTSSGIYSDTIPNANGCDSIITIDLTIISVDTSVTLNQSTLTANATGASYQWIDCNNGNSLIEEEIYQSFMASTNGNYAVRVTKNGCTDTSACITVNLSVLSDNGFKNNITLYPNPNDGSFTIDLGSVYPKIELTITELDGRIIQKERRSDSRHVDLTMVASPGMYMVIVTADNERAVFRILKK